MLCKDGELLLGCEVEVEVVGWYITVYIRRTRRAYKLDLSSVLDITYEELSGKLLLTLADGRMIEMQPQVTEDRDVVSKVLVFFTLLKNPSSIDPIGRVLKAFGRSVDAALNLASALRGTEQGISWKRISELAEKVTNAAKLDEDLWAGLSKEDVYHLHDSVSRRDIKGTLGSTKNIIASLYRSAGLTLSKVLPGTSPEVLLDVILAAISSIALRTLKISLSEEEVVSLEEVASSSLKRFTNVMNIDESLAEKLEALVRSCSDIEELIEGVVSVLAENYQRVVRVSQETSRRD